MFMCDNLTETYFGKGVLVLGANSETEFFIYLRTGHTLRRSVSTKHSTKCRMPSDLLFLELFSLYWNLLLKEKSIFWRGLHAVLD